MTWNYNRNRTALLQNGLAFHIAEMVKVFFRERYQVWRSAYEPQSPKINSAKQGCDGQPLWLIPTVALWALLIYFAPFNVFLIFFFLWALYVEDGGNGNRVMSADLAVLLF